MVGYTALMANVQQSHGLLTDHFVSEAARQRILREVVRRAYKAASDVIYAW